MTPQIVKSWTKEIQGQKVDFQITHVTAENTDADPFVLAMFFNLLDVDWYCGYAIFPAPLFGEEISGDYWFLKDKVRLHVQAIDGTSVNYSEQKANSYVYGFGCYDAMDDPNTRDLDWLTNECESMAEQLLKLATEG